MRLLSVCDAMVNLHLLSGSRRLLPLLGALGLHRLSLTLHHLFPRPGGFDFSQPLFTKITHLDVSDWLDHGWESWSRARGHA